MNRTILCKRPVGFRVRRANDDGLTLSKTEWRHFTDEAEAAREADALCTDYQGLYVRDGAAIVAEWEDVATAPKDGSSFLGVWWSDISVGRAPEPHISVCSWAGGWTPYDRKLTHWMPLPAPPQAPASPDLKVDQQPTVSE